MLNKKSDFLVILVATCDRLSFLKKTIKSIYKYTRIPFEIIVIDGGSTDGTKDFLSTAGGITPVFQKSNTGAVSAYNSVWKRINCKYTCWLSDDTELTGSGLDTAVKILNAETDIGMVGLKTKDTCGPWSDTPYIGGISKSGILNCNHGVIEYQLLKKIGFFNNKYFSYLMDPDLTASVLCTGKKVVMTKKVFIHHNREWAKNMKAEEFLNMFKNKISRYQKIYDDKFNFLIPRASIKENAVNILKKFTSNILTFAGHKNIFHMGKKYRDWNNIILSRYINFSDILINKNREYYLVQKIPYKFLSDSGNPYIRLFRKNILKYSG